MKRLLLVLLLGTSIAVHSQEQRKAADHFQNVAISNQDISLSNGNYKNTLVPKQTISDGDFSDGTIWTGGTAPNEFEWGVINHNLYINSAVEVFELNVNGVLEIQPGGSMSVITSLTISGDLVVKSDAIGTGSLITNGTVSGDITLERYFTTDNRSSVTDGWHLLSSPVSTQTISDFHTPGSGNDFFSFDGDHDTWTNRTTTGGGLNFGFETNFEVGKGYLVGFSTETTKSFVGSINTASVTKNTTYAGGDLGWNLLGNPFTSAIDWDNVTYSGSIDNAVYVYDDNIGDYLSYVSGAGTLTDGIIPSMQGFFVHATDAGQSVTMEPADRVHSTTDFYKSSKSVEGTMKVEVSGEKGSTEHFIRFNDQATIDFDSQWDAYKLFGFSNSPMIYSYDANYKYSVNSLPISSLAQEVKLGIKTSDKSAYVLKFGDMAEITNKYQVQLEDKLSNTWIDISEGSEYHFTSEEGFNEDRFVLHFGATGIYEIAKESLQAYISGQNLYINGEEGQVTLNIYDMQGKQLYNEQVELNSQFRKSLDLPQGVYVVSVQSNDLVKTAKVIIK